MKTSAEIIQAFKDAGDRATMHAIDVENAKGEHGGTGLIVLGAVRLVAIWSCAEGWDHVSVSTRARTPKYQEMKFMKRLFFRPDEWAIEFHPPESEYISINGNVLHMWRPHGIDLPKPPKMMI